MGETKVKKYQKHQKQSENHGVSPEVKKNETTVEMTCGKDGF